MSYTAYYTSENSTAIQKRLGKKEKVANTNEHLNKMIQANNQLTKNVLKNASNPILLADIDELQRWAKSLCITCANYKNGLSTMITKTEGFDMSMVDRLPYDMIWYINRFLQYRKDVVIGKSIARRVLYDKLYTMKEQYLKMFFYYSILPNLESISRSGEDWGRWDKHYYMKKVFGLCKKDLIELIDNILEHKPVKIKMGYMMPVNMKICYKKFIDRGNYIYDKTLKTTKKMDKNIKEKVVVERKRINDYIDRYGNSWGDVPEYVW